MQYFADDNGLPLSSACVYFYIPGTTTPKATYQNAAQTVANTNPVQLDAAGRAIIYGTGVYRQIVRASNGTITPCSPAGVQIWDQLTASTDSSATIFAGASAGTPNAITVTAPGFSGTDGQVINYISTNTNTAAATLNPSGFGAIQIMRDSATGPGALTGGELVATNAVSVIYDATAGIFHILSPVTWPNSGGVPVGTTLPYSGFTAPSGYAFANGQLASRTTYASLLSAITSAQSGSISSGSAVITGLSDTSQFGNGTAVESVGIPASTTIRSCTSTTCTMSANATVTRTGTITFYPYGNGDGSTTFEVPNYNGYGLTGRDNGGGTTANVIQASTTITTTSASATATVGSAANLAAGMTIVSTNVTPGTAISSISGTTITMTAPATASAVAIAARFSQFSDAQQLGSSGGTITKQIVANEIPSITPAGTITNGAITITGGIYGGTFAGGSIAANGADFNAVRQSASIGTSQASSTFTGTPFGGGAPLQYMQPNKIVNYIIRIVP